ncbi:hypothetical protein BOC44_33820 [Burkholderia pseudomallei]|nr:hypothetical protein BOC44_33820 [Burkholderia pseudomallei]
MLVERCHRVLRVCVAASARRAMRGDGRPVRAGLSAVRVPLACRLPVVCLSFVWRVRGGSAARPGFSASPRTAPSVRTHERMARRPAAGADPPAAPRSAAQRGTARCGTARHGTVRHGAVRCGAVRCGAHGSRMCSPAECPVAYAAPVSRR